MKLSRKKWERQTEPNAGTQFSVRARPGKGLAGHFSRPLWANWNKQSDCPQKPAHLREPLVGIAGGISVLSSESAGAVVERWKRAGVLALAIDDRHVRAVTHYDVSHAQVVAACERLELAMREQT